MNEKNEALVLIDIQNDYFPGGRYPLKGMKKAARQAAALLDAWRNDNRPVVHVRHTNIHPGSAFFLPGTAGAMTNMCIDTTVRAGFDLGYSMVLHQGACAAVGFLGTRLVHRITVKTLESVFARVV